MNHIIKAINPIWFKLKMYSMNFNKTPLRFHCVINATFYSYQVFPFEFYIIFINRGFSEHFHRFAFVMTYCLQKEKVGKKKVLERNSFDNIF